MRLGLSRKLRELLGISHQREQPVADQVRRRFLAADHGHDAVGHDFLVGQPIAIDLSRHEGVNQSFARMLARFVDRRLKVVGQIVRALENSWNAIGVMLKIAQHLRKIGRPFF